MKVLFVQPPFLKEGIASLVKYAPMGLIAVAGYIRQNKNIQVEIYDANTKNNKEPVLETIDYIIRRNPDVLGLTSMTANIECALKICESVKKINPKIITVIGGIHATVAPEQVLKNENVDFIVVGEGEITFDKFLKKINYPETFSQINGLGYKENGKIKINKKEELIKDLNQLPIPAYDLLEIDYYRSPYGLKANFISILRSRGCPFQCIFCGVQNMFGRSYRVQTPERTIQEIDYLINKFKIKEIGFKDSEFTLNQENVSRLCDLLIERKYDLVWSCNARVDCDNLELYQKMKKAGCHTISFGAESGDQNILNTIKKGITIEQTKQTIKNVKQAGIRVSANFILGNPGDTKETIEKTIKFAKDINPDYVAFCFSTPFPGTELREMAIKNNWLINPDLTSVAYMELIMNATNLNNKDLKKYMSKAYKSFYFRPSYIFKRLTMINKDEIKTSIYGFLALLKTVFKNK
ncbi:MAG: radical SAM protein [bacterium]